MEINKPIMYYNILTSTVKLHRRYIIFILTCVEENGCRRIMYYTYEDEEVFALKKIDDDNKTSVMLLKNV